MTDTILTPQQLDSLLYSNPPNSVPTEYLDDLANKHSEGIIKVKSWKRWDCGKTEVYVGAGDEFSCVVALFDKNTMSETHKIARDSILKYLTEQGAIRGDWLYIALNKIAI